MLTPPSLYLQQSVGLSGFLRLGTSDGKPLPSPEQFLHSHFIQPFGKEADGPALTADIL